MHKRTARGQRAKYVLSCLLVCGIPIRAWSQYPAQVGESIYLGDWLVSQRALQEKTRPVGITSDQLYTSAIVVTRPLDRAIQEARWKSLLTQIKYQATKSPIATTKRDGLFQFIASMQPTGRIPVKSGDARWLQANPDSDPKLASGDTVTIPLRPSTVTVVRDDGTQCEVPFKANAEAAYYLRICAPEITADIAWIAQPNGVVSKAKIGIWNRESQEPPAPGAWIWAPPRGGLWSEDVSDRIANFLATQPPSGLHGASASNIVTPSTTAISAASSYAARKFDDLQITANDWGSEGLLQTPSARMGPAGEASITLSNVNPYTRLSVMLHPLDWFEFGFRYTDISNHLYGPAALSGNQSYKDKSIDAKIRLIQESAYVPQVALGFVDIGGTGLFSSEYLVASKRTGGFDWSLGLGWGYIGNRGDISNPLSVLSDKFKVRPAGSQSGEVAGGVGKSYFRGPMALFGGVQYQLPNLPLIIKAEYDGNDYKHDPFGYNADARLPVNLGIVYRFNNNLDFSAGFERGNKLMLGVSLHGDLSRAGRTKVNDPAPLPVSLERPTTVPSPENWKKTADDLFQQTNWRVLDIGRRGKTLVVSFENPDAFYRRDALDRIATVLQRDSPADIDIFRIVTLVQGQPVRSYVINRNVWVDSKSRAVPDSDKVPLVIATPPPSKQILEDAPKYFEQPFKRFYYSIGPGYSQTLGGPNGFVLYSISASINAAFRVTQDTWVAGGLSYRLLDNYGHFTYTAPSELPRVRTFIREYMTTSRFNIPYLQGTHVGMIGQNQYFSVYGGLLEPMFGGVGAEWLYRPAASPIAIGVDANAVQQRDFSQDFGFRSYKVLTGHITAYWDTGWNDVLVRLSVGQYLAKDKGASIDVSRRFQNGVSIGAYATKTNVSSAQFGEGSFDKGIYVQIPFDAIMGRSMGGTANLVWQPLLRDGGAKLARQFPLYDLTDERSPKSLWYQPGPGADKQ